MQTLHDILSRPEERRNLTIVAVCFATVIVVVIVFLGVSMFKFGFEPSLVRPDTATYSTEFVED